MTDPTTPAAPPSASPAARPPKQARTGVKSNGVRKAASKSNRSRAREFVLQALYQHIVGRNEATAIDSFTRDLAGFHKADAAHYNAVLHGCINTAAELDALITPLLDRKMAEISPIEHATMWIGVYEFQHCLDVPWRVVLNECIELAKEWACAGLDDGFANRYTLTTDGLLFLDLSQPPYTILNWLAMLVENRRFQPTTAVAAQGIEYLKQVFLPDASQADVIVGYRADDSYFSFARAFVNNAISIDQLAEAMRLGELGKQIVLASPQAFAALRFQGCEIARASTYHGLRNERDRTAREAYRRKSAEADLDGLFMRDIIREKVTNDDPRL